MPGVVMSCEDGDECKDGCGRERGTDPHLEVVAGVLCDNVEVPELGKVEDLVLGLVDKVGPAGACDPALFADVWAGHVVLVDALDKKVNPGLEVRVAVGVAGLCKGGEVPHGALVGAVGVAGAEEVLGGSDGHALDGRPLGEVGRGRASKIGRGPRVRGGGGGVLDCAEGGVGRIHRRRRRGHPHGRASVRCPVPRVVRGRARREVVGRGDPERVAGRGPRRREVGPGGRINAPAGGGHGVCG